MRTIEQAQSKYDNPSTAEWLYFVDELIELGYKVEKMTRSEILEAAEKEQL